MSSIYISVKRAMAISEKKLCFKHLLLYQPEILQTGRQLQDT